MRETFHEQLDDITNRLTLIIVRIGELMQRASTALVAGNVAVADQVIAETASLDAMRAEVESLSFDILARQAPVATDLRRLISANQIIGELERMGALTRHIAWIAANTPQIATTHQALNTLQHAGQLAGTITELVTEVISSRDLTLMPAVHDTEAAMNATRAELFKIALDPGWSHGVEACIRLTEAGRYFERYADHAVKVADSISFIVTGTT